MLSASVGMVKIGVSSGHRYLDGPRLTDWQTFKKTKQICGDSAGEERTEMIDFRVARNENRMNPMELDHGNWERRSGRLEFELVSPFIARYP